MIKITVDPKSFTAIAAVENAVRKVVFAANLDLWNAVVMVPDHPVNGFARASWWVQANGSPGDHPSAPNVGTSYGPPSPDAAVLIEAIGGVLSIVNSAPYINRLEYEGHSPQGRGWVNRAAAGYEGFVRKRVEEVASKL